MLPAVLGPGGKIVWVSALTQIPFSWGSRRGNGQLRRSMLRAAAGTRAVHTDSAQGVRAGEIPLGRCYSEGKKVSLVMFTVA